jgi:SanA protein
MKSIFSKKFFLMVYFPLFIVGLLMLFFCNYKVEQHAIGKTYFDTDKIPFNKVGLLLGTCKTLKDKKTINPFWKYRLASNVCLVESKER